MSGQPNGGDGSHFYGFADDPAQDHHIQNMIDHASDFLPLQGVSQAPSHTLGASDLDGNDGEHFNIYGHLNTSIDDLDDFAHPRQNSPSSALFHSSSPTVENSSPSMRLSLRRPKSQTASRPSLPQPPAPTAGISVDLQHAPSNLTPKVAGTHLVDPRAALPTNCQAVFPYNLFNAVQSKCFPLVYGSDDNVVVSAPTGSGKTAILEMAICKLISSPNGENFKIVYQAPTKSLCSERARDWEKKFSHLNLECVELTGDTSPSQIRRVGTASIIVTTPEKWDSITRKWSDHHRLLDMVRLVLIDEVHIVKDIRGATLEAVVSRMKTSGANVRFIALSATVPNLHDLAMWLGRTHRDQAQPAQRLGFGEEMRPVKLKKHVHGYDCPGNEHMFDKTLDSKLISLLSRYGERKPVMVFCLTRKSCEQTAKKLAEWWASHNNDNRPWPGPKSRVPVMNKYLQEIVSHGVAFHHAGLDAADRASVERSYLHGELHVICCTSTLAVGVNLPCHTVVLKGTSVYVDNGLQECSDLEVMQMLGRAGRPQFDRSATAIIMTRSSNVQKYEKMISGQEILESKLHLNLIEHLNSEIGLGTIKNLDTAKKWLSGTFLFVRMRQAPHHYLSDMPETDKQNRSKPEDLIQAWCERDIEQLQTFNLITRTEPLSCTQYGTAMARYMIPFDTMKELLDIPIGSNVEQLLISLSKTATFRDLRFKSHERGFLQKINSEVMYPIKGPISDTWHKVYLLVQFSLATLEMPADESNSIKRQTLVETNIIFDRLNRLVRCVIDCKVFDCDGMGAKAGLELTRALAAKSWDYQPTQLQQVPGVGPVITRKLASHGVKTVSDLATRSFVDIERFVGRNSPYGKKLLQSLEGFPRLKMTTSIIAQNVQTHSKPGEAPVVMVKSILGFDNKQVPTWNNRIPIVTFIAYTGGRLVHFARGNLRHIGESETFALKFAAVIQNADETITCCFSCEEIVGTEVTEVISHNLRPRAFEGLPQGISSAQSNEELSEQSIGEIDEEGIADVDMLSAFVVTNSDGREKPESQPRLAELDEELNMEFQDIDEILKEESISQEQKIAMAVPVQMSNGKWKCNHHCAGGALTKAGKQCTHKCCHEGLDKPRPPNQKKGSAKNKKQQVKEASSTEGDVLTTKGQPIGAQGSDLDDTEVETNSSSANIGRKRSSVPSTSQKKAADDPRPMKKNKQLDASDDDIECIDLCSSDGGESLSPPKVQSNVSASRRAQKRLSDLHRRVQPQTVAPSRLTKPCKALREPQGEQTIDEDSCFDSDVFDDESEDFPSLSDMIDQAEDSQSRGTTQEALIRDETLGPDIFKAFQENQGYGYGPSLSFTTVGELEKATRCVKPDEVEMNVISGEDAGRSKMEDDMVDDLQEFELHEKFLPDDDVSSGVDGIGGPADHHFFAPDPDDLGAEVEAQMSTNPSSVKLATPLPGEPAWVAEYDLELIAALRGAVDFVE
ncbi:Sec63 [Pestalotiopsis sp. 9143b]|nr:Sec63 [Pestalotiopsis sp. 9143b]